MFVHFRGMPYLNGPLQQYQQQVCALPDSTAPFSRLLLGKHVDNFQTITHICCQTFSFFVISHLLYTFYFFFFIIVFGPIFSLQMFL